MVLPSTRSYGEVDWWPRSWTLKLSRWQQLTRSSWWSNLVLVMVSLSCDGEPAWSNSCSSNPFADALPAWLAKRTKVCNFVPNNKKNDCRERDLMCLNVYTCWDGCNGCLWSSTPTPTVTPLTVPAILGSQWDQCQLDSTGTVSKMGTPTERVIQTRTASEMHDHMTQGLLLQHQQQQHDECFLRFLILMERPRPLAMSSVSSRDLSSAW